MKTQPQFINSKMVIKSTDGNLPHLETNDCSVYAIANALSISYSEAHKIVQEQCGRQNKRGVMALQYMNYLLTIGTHVIGEEKAWEVAPWNSRPIYKYSAPKRIGKKTGLIRSMNVRQFCEMYPTGTFVVCVANHTFTIIDGTIIGNMKDGAKLKTEICFAVKIK